MRVNIFAAIVSPIILVPLFFLAFLSIEGFLITESSEAYIEAMIYVSMVYFPIALVSMLLINIPGVWILNKFKHFSRIWLIPIGLLQGVLILLLLSDEWRISLEPRGYAKYYSFTIFCLLSGFISTAIYTYLSNKVINIPKWITIALTVIFIIPATYVGYRYTNHYLSVLFVDDFVDKYVQSMSNNTAYFIEHTRDEYQAGLAKEMRDRFLPPYIIKWKVMSGGPYYLFQTAFQYRLYFDNQTSLYLHILGDGHNFQVEGIIDETEGGVS